MYSRLIFTLGICLVIMTCKGSDYPKEGYFLPEPDCSSAGGLCILKDLCPVDKLATGRNCPVQKSLGAACCFSMPKNETRCKKLGGECMAPSCRTVHNSATDCQTPNVCCILI